MKYSPSLDLREVVLFGILGALTFAAQVVMSALPNIEPVSLMVMLFAAVFGWKSIFPIAVFVAMEIAAWGLGTWTINYLYIWLILAFFAWLMRKSTAPLAWALLSGTFGLLFGALCGIVDVCIGGLAYAVAKWSTGILFDIAHCIGNFVIALLLFCPLRKQIEKLYRRMRRGG